MKGNVIPQLPQSGPEAHKYESILKRPGLHFVDDHFTYPARVLFSANKQERVLSTIISCFRERPTNMDGLYLPCFGYSEDVIVVQGHDHMAFNQVQFRFNLFNKNIWEHAVGVIRFLNFTTAFPGFFAGLFCRGIFCQGISCQRYS